MSTCILCNAKATINIQDNASRAIYNCQNCGVFVVSDLIISEVKKYQCELAAYFTHRKLAELNEVVLISYDKKNRDKDYLQLTVNQILECFPIPFSDRMDMVLENLTLMSSYEGEEIKVDSLQMFPVFCVKKITYDALSFMIKSMQKLELLEVNYYGNSFFPCGVTISSKGWERVSKIRSGGTGDNKTLILHAGKEDENSEIFYITAVKAARACGCHVVESRVVSSGNKINEEIVALIKESQFLITDMSGGVGTAYYAAGMAAALGKTNILTCHSSSVKKLEVDTGQISVACWNDAEELYYQILNAIRARVL